MLKKNKNKKIIILITIILIVLIIVISILLNINNTNKIKKSAILWYNDQNGLYNETTIGALYKNGYINSNKSLFLKQDLSCKIIKIENNKAIITNDVDCNLNDQMQKIPTLIVNLYKTSDNSKYDPNTWTSSDIEVKLSYKNNNLLEEDINRIYLTKDYSENKDDNSLIISTQSFIEDTYTINIMLNDGSIYSKDFSIKIDKTKPIYIDKEITNEDYKAYFEDNESNLDEVLYYLTDNNTPPTNIDQFNKKENISLESDKTYQVWAVATNNANLYSDFIEIGNFSLKTFEEE